MKDHIEKLRKRREKKQTEVKSVEKSPELNNFMEKLTKMANNEDEELAESENYINIFLK